MCPISGMVQFLIVVVTLLLLCHVTIVRSLQIVFKPENVTLHMYDTVSVHYEVITGPDEIYNTLKLYTDDPNVSKFGEQEVYLITEPKGFFNLTGHFLGRTQIVCVDTEDRLDVTVIRKKRVIDTIFTSSVATLVSILYINFGCALKWSELRKNMRRPIGPVIGILGQFLIMPLLSFGLAKALFPDNPAMQLGMFFTGVTPAGGASNSWTAVLDGNIDLSITMTTLSTLASFGFMPLWLFTLGTVIFDQGDIQVPYNHIGTYLVALVLPLGIGFLISRYLPKVSKFLVRILKGLSAVILLFIIIFAIVTNLYLFELFSWKIVVAGMGLPWLGYTLGYVMATLLKQPPPDCLAIAIETGIQNTGIAIFMLKFSLPQPEADLTAIAPVAVATMTPLPLLVMFVYKKIQARIYPSHSKLTVSQETHIDDDSKSQRGGDKLIPTIS